MLVFWEAELEQQPECQRLSPSDLSQKVTEYQYSEILIASIFAFHEISWFNYI